LSASHRICVMGRELQVRSAASSETVREVEAIVNAKLAEVAAAVQVSDTQLVAILALMNIAEAYLAVQKERDLLQSQGEATVRRLLGRIEQDFS
jgi:cell division protein ZapA